MSILPWRNFDWKQMFCCQWHTFVKKGYLALVVKLLAVEIDQKQLNYVYWKRGVMLGISFKLKPPLVLQTLGLIVWTSWKYWIDSVDMITWGHRKAFIFHDCILQGGSQQKDRKKTSIYRHVAAILAGKRRKHSLFFETFLAGCSDSSRNGLCSERFFQIPDGFQSSLRNHSRLLVDWGGTWSCCLGSLAIFSSICKWGPWKWATVLGSRACFRNWWCCMNMWVGIHIYTILYTLAFICNYASWSNCFYSFLLCSSPSNI